VTRLFAPAKLTVTLDVTGVRPDGYHELRAEMFTLDLADELIVSEPGAGITVESEPWIRAAALTSGAQNLIGTALTAVGRNAGVKLHKRIPVGGGLGGGSADAAAILRWAGDDDPVVAAGLGADVPFCVVGGRAVVEGIGERVTPLEFEHREYLLCLPPFGVNTARVYAAWDETPSNGAPNALEAAALRVEPRLAMWREALGNLTGTNPVLAGSGSTWFVDVTGTEPHGEPEPESTWLTLGDQRARLVRAAAVPSGWDGT
jgi:4-diphosphocytidyl-2-C-methyl-D-erythritol kinase